MTIFYVEKGNHVRVLSKLFVLTTLLFSSAPLHALSLSFDKLVERFAADYKDLTIPDLSLSYVDNLKGIQDLSGIERQENVVRSYQEELDEIDCESLDGPLEIICETLKYQLELDGERLALERDFRENSPGPIPESGLLQVRNGRQWYRYFVKKWASTEMTPSELVHFGMSEVKRVQGEIAAIQKQLGFEGNDTGFYAHLNSPQFVITDEKELLRRLGEFRDQILSALPKVVEKTNIPHVDIQPAPNPTKDTPPGYYENNVFYYNFFGGKFRLRSLEWLFIHEAIPGHHYQGSVAPKTPIRELFWYPGYTEGWAAYTEDLGKELGAYQDAHSFLGKWEWDLVRSSRIVLDVGINYFGWSKSKALAFWHRNIRNQDDIAEREIDRMFRWPAQVLTYKVGEREFLNLRNRFKASQGSHFDLRRFHSLVLEHGSIPLPVLSTSVQPW